MVPWPELVVPFRMSFHFPLVLAKQGEIAFLVGCTTSGTRRSRIAEPSSVW